jgi:DNA end-binding protein Ku
MEILEFVPEAEVDPIYLESSYYLSPEEGGEKPYALLFAALRESKYVGVAKIAMHNREHIVILRPGAKGIVLHTMYFEDEVRKIDEFRTDQDLVKEKELALARMLVESLAASFEPGKYQDSYRENLKELIQAKLDNRKVVEIAPPPVAPVIDIMEALKRSLEIKKKPVASAPEPVTEITPEVAAAAGKARRRKRSTA